MSRPWPEELATPSPARYREWARVLENRSLPDDHVILVLESIHIWRSAQPGQFVQVSLPPDAGGPLLPRPFSFLETAPGRISLLLRGLGRGTRLMASSTAGTGMWVLGPLGRGFSGYRASGRPLLLVGGGVGVPPLHHLVTTLGSDFRAEAYIGARSAGGLLCISELEACGCPVQVATDDGSAGHHGLVTDLVARRLQSGPEPLVLACGPAPMLAGVAALTAGAGVECQVAMEAPMACGFGVCLGCAVPVVDSGGYALVCRDGPVFDARSIRWEP